MKKFLSLIVICTLFAACNTNSVETDLIPVKSGDKYQYIDKEGKIIINPQFAKAALFRDGLALVAIESKKKGDDNTNLKWGFIDKEGKYAITPQYKSATSFSEGIAWVVRENNAPEAINTKGEVLFAMTQAQSVSNFHEGLAPFSTIDKENNFKWGFVNKKGEIVIAAQFYRVGGFKDGLCIVGNKDNKWGYINNKGEIVINYQFDIAYSFTDGRARVANKKKSDSEEVEYLYGVINKDGKYTINPQFNQIFMDGKNAVCEQDEKWGYCDKDGKYIINPQFDYFNPFNGENLAAVRMDEKWGYIDNDGKYVINPQFDAALPFIDGIAAVESDDKIGFIDEDGKYVINPQFDDISEDYFYYVFYKDEAYSYVETDFLDISVFTNTINTESPNGLSLEMTYNEIMTKYNLTEDDFSKYSNEKQLGETCTIGNNLASYVFYAIGNPYTQYEVVNDAYYYSWTETKYKFDSSLKPSGYAYQVYLLDKCNGKEEKIIAELKKSIEKKYKLIGNSNSNTYTYSDGTKYIHLIISENLKAFAVYISNKNLFGEITETPAVTEEAVPEVAPAV